MTNSTALRSLQFYKTCTRQKRRFSLVICEIDFEGTERIEGKMKTQKHCQFNLGRAIFHYMEISQLRSAKYESGCEHLMMLSHQAQFHLLALLLPDLGLWPFFDLYHCEFKGWSRIWWVLHFAGIVLYFLHLLFPPSMI